MSGFGHNWGQGIPTQNSGYLAYGDPLYPYDERGQAAWEEDDASTQAPSHGEQAYQPPLYGSDNAGRGSDRISGPAAESSYRSSASIDAWAYRSGGGQDLRVLPIRITAINTHGTAMRSGLQDSTGNTSHDEPQPVSPSSTMPNVGSLESTNQGYLVDNMNIGSFQLSSHVRGTDDSDPASYRQARIDQLLETQPGSARERDHSLGSVEVQDSMRWCAEQFPEQFPEDEAQDPYGRDEDQGPSSWYAPNVVLFSGDSDEEVNGQQQQVGYEM